MDIVNKNYKRTVISSGIFTALFLIVAIVLIVNPFALMGILMPSGNSPANAILGIIGFFSMFLIPIVMVVFALIIGAWAFAVIGFAAIAKSKYAPNPNSVRKYRIFIALDMVIYGIPGAHAFSSLISSMLIGRLNYLSLLILLMTIPTMINVCYDTFSDRIFSQNQLYGSCKPWD